MNKRYINPSGFTENLPNEQIVEDTLKGKFKDTAELYGYTRLETASVEYMDTLASEGDINKEIYTIDRAQGEGSEEEGKRGLHFDLTVPFARYVAQHQGALSFPFRRYQIQKVWRGERPQKGRFREFYQADIDVVGHQTLPLQFDAEVALVMARILGSFELGSVTMRISNRKFLNGLFYCSNIQPTPEILQTIDKLDKLGPVAVKKLLVEKHNLPNESVEKVFTYLGTPISLNGVFNFLDNTPIGDSDFEEGKKELAEIFSLLTKAAPINNFKFVFDPSIARGLDYYTGTVYETTIDGFEKYGSICSGGRYADLANRFTNQKLPGVGMSIGLTRLLSILKEEKLVSFEKKTNSVVLVHAIESHQNERAFEIAESLRQNGLNTEMSYKSKAALKTLLSDAQTKGIRFVILCENDNTLSLYTVGSGKESTLSIEEISNRIKSTPCK